MPVPTSTTLFDVHDCRVAPLLTDTVGSAPTYGTMVDVPGIAEVSLDPNLVTAELKGDARVIAKKGRTDRLNFSATYGEFNADTLAVLLGTTVAQAGAATDGGPYASTNSSGSAVLPSSNANFQQLDVGKSLTGTGVAGGATILSVQSATSATMSAVSTAGITSFTIEDRQPDLAVVRLKSPASLQYFKIEFAIQDLSLGLADLHVVLYKAQVTGGTLIGSSSDNFGQPSFQAEAIALNGDLPKVTGGGVDTGVMGDWRLSGGSAPNQPFGL